MRLLIDTNSYVAFCQGAPAVTGWFKSADELHIPFIVLGELRAGFEYGTHSKSNESKLQGFLSSKRVQALHADEDTTHHYGRLFAQLKRSGAPIPTNDLWIASLALQHNLPLLSLDRHFEAIPQLALLPYDRTR